MALWLRRGGVTRYKRPYGDVPPTWVAKSVSWYMNECKIWYINGLIFSKFSPILAKIGSNVRKFWKNRVILLTIWPKIEQIGIWMGHFFLKNWYLYESTFKFRGGTCLPKPNFSTPGIEACFLKVHRFSQIFYQRKECYKLVFILSNWKLFSQSPSQFLDFKNLQYIISSIYTRLYFLKKKKSSFKDA